MAGMTVGGLYRLLSTPTRAAATPARKHDGRDRSRGWESTVVKGRMLIKQYPGDRGAATREVAMVVALYVNGEGRDAWPSAATIGAIVGRSERRVRDHLSKLVRDGFLLVDKRPGKTDVYGLALPTGYRYGGTSANFEATNPSPPRTGPAGRETTPDSSLVGEQGTQDATVRGSGRDRAFAVIEEARRLQRGLDSGNCYSAEPGVARPIPTTGHAEDTDAAWVVGQR